MCPLRGGLSRLEGSNELLLIYRFAALHDRFSITSVLFLLLCVGRIIQDLGSHKRSNSQVSRQSHDPLGSRNPNIAKINSVGTDPVVSADLRRFLRNTEDSSPYYEFSICSGAVWSRICAVWSRMEAEIFDGRFQAPFSWS